MSYHRLSRIFIYFFSLTLNVSLALSPEEQKLESLMEIHYLNDKTKSSHDLVKVNGPDAFIQVWRDLPPEPRADEIECLGYQWLISGRGAKIGEGVSEVFKNFPKLQTLELRLVDIDFDTESLDKRGKLKRTEKLKTYLRMKIKRSEVEKYLIETDKVKKELRSGTGACIKIGRKLNIEKEIQL